MGGSSKSEKTTIDPQLMGLYNKNYDTASQVADTPFTPYTGERVASFSPTQQQGQAGILAAANNPTATNNLNTATNNVGGLLNYQPQQISAPTQVNANPITAGQLSRTDLAPYMNPFQSQVIDASIAQNGYARDQQGVKDNAAATAAHAFGGSRQGVQAAETTAGYDRNSQQNIAELNSANFGQARQGAQYDIGNRLSADQFNSGQQFNADQFNATGGYNANVANAANGIAGAGVRLNASGLLGNLAGQQQSMGLQNAGAIEAVGANQTAMQQAQDQAAYEEFMRQLQYPYQQQDLRNQALGMIPKQSTTTSSSTGDVMGGILGTLLGGAKIGSSMYGGN